MRRMWDSYSTYYTRSPSWLVSILLLLTSVLIVLLVPPIILLGPDRETEILVVHIIAGIFAGLGIFYLVGWLGDFYFEANFRFYRPVWTFWYNYVGGLFAAAVFAVPAAIALPGLLAAYFFRPNVFFSADSTLNMNTTLAAIFISAIGVSLVIYRWYWVVERYKTRPVVEII